MVAATKDMVECRHLYILAEIESTASYHIDAIRARKQVLIKRFIVSKQSLHPTPQIRSLNGGIRTF
jgi:hypothetical protein